ncbi:thiamine pyrophosphate-requiring protein [Pseudomonadales bacterium]|jgi:thiamine pyrophosphate-dependent acetolactate synthase large subunit-like protein|nr:thiamine pyrophosphate-requiring protein [Gammaproteobacteria bacterium]MDA7725539.1 thiamine pyrophosphate-requiring protein [Pseudomonadales bacterium]MBT3709280.1 thiamine pyrophosphate-requiring protein [Gammaproteobacteria bacterium]MBT3734961.1 thiamine pyrophosphate-requiring protein [Gammaproteobacteria bacterium]MDC1017394.1 thiamine pyrophosphate-requiring protein [Pseudomonadales bacterium]|tara:strand:- start:2881 stop:4515 length:1635 start_codon:yes stop_codon:yes gene_type:complete
MKVVNAIAEILKRENIKYIIGYPVNPIIEAAAEADIRTIIVRQERVGLHMADAVSRLSSGNDIGVFVMQHGPGAENAFGGVAQAFSESVPILVMPAGYQRRIANYFPNFNSTLNMQHITKWAEPITMGRTVPEVMRRAFSQLRNGRGGPVMIEIPLDVFGEEVSDDFTYVPSFATRSAPDPADITQVAKVLASANNPVIYAGQGVHYAQAWPELKELAETWNIPVTTSIEGKSAFPENHPLSLGSGGRSLPRNVHEFLRDSDVILGIGCSFALTAFGVQMPKGKTIIHATLDPMDLNKDVPVQHALVGDAKLTLQGLIAEMDQLPKTTAEARKEAIPARIKETKAAWLAEWMPKLTNNEAPISPYRVIWDLLHTVDRDNTVITHDAGSPRDQIMPFWESTTPLSYIGWGKTTQLGYGLGLAMGAKLARPDALCINVWGDAAIGFTGMDFETAVRERLPILSILFNNFSMAIELPIMQVSTEKYRATDISGHYADMAQAFGGYGERITDPNEILPAIKRGIEATQKGQAALLEFITDKELALSTF